MTLCSSCKNQCSPSLDSQLFWFTIFITVVHLYIANELTVQTQFSTKLASSYHTQLNLTMLAWQGGWVFKSLCFNIHNTTVQQPKQELGI